MMGIIRSRRIMSGFSCEKILIASMPLSAVSTLNCSNISLFLYICCTTFESSTSNILSLIVKFYIRVNFMSKLNFIESIKNDRRFNTQIVEHKYIYPVKARYMKLVIPDRLKDVLKGRGLEYFYSHQVEAINFIREGENVVVMTPTASGKSLIYNIPVLESIIENPEQRALYIFPLKGLEQDQVINLNELYNAVASSTLNSSSSPTPPIKGGERVVLAPVDRAIYKPSPLVGEGKGGR